MTSTDDRGDALYQESNVQNEAPSVSNDGSMIRQSSGNDGNASSLPIIHDNSEEVVGQQNQVPFKDATEIEEQPQQHQQQETTTTGEEKFVDNPGDDDDNEEDRLVMDAFTWKEFSDWATTDIDDIITANRRRRKHRNASDDIENGAFKTTMDNHDLVQDFLGPDNHERLVHEIRRRRQDHLSHPRKGVEFSTVCYETMDTMVWHHRNNHIARRGLLRKRMIGSNTNDDDDNNNDNIKSMMSSAVQHVSSPYRRSDETLMMTALVISLIAFLMSSVGFFISWSAENLLDLKIDLAVQHSDHKGANLWRGFAIFVTINMVFLFGMILPVIYRPHAAGSGIAEAKAVLNGIEMPGCTELMTGFCKGVSVIFATAASLPVGLEGPMIFIGLSIGKSITRFIPKSYAELKTDQAKRDFAAVGTASGVSVAFYAPIGGVLFALEEGASFWSQSLLFRCFYSACLTLFVSYVWVVLSAGKIGQPIDFSDIAKFTGIQGHNDNNFPFFFYLRDYFFFILLGIAGGVLGAIFNSLSKRLATWRRRKITSSIRQFWELATLTFLMSTLVWWLPKLYRVCSPVANAGILQSEEEVLRQYDCPESEYNHLATLTLNEAGTALNLLFHSQKGAFDAGVCLLVGVVYYVMLLLLFGSATGMGIFIPLLLIGACFGRSFGEVITSWYNRDSDDNTTAIFAIVASTAMLGGVAQVLISLSVIMMQATALSYFVVAFMLATIFARVTARWLGSEGIYDQILELKGIPFLEEAPPDYIRLNTSLRARDIMSADPMTVLQPEMRIGALLEVVKTKSLSQSEGEFTVLAPDHKDALIGTIQKKHILRLLQHKSLFYSDQDEGTSRAGRALRYEELVDTGVEVLVDETAVEKSLTEQDLALKVDLTPYLQIAPKSVEGHGSAERAYETFRSAGLRTLHVLDPEGSLLGVIRRQDLALLKEMEIPEGNNEDDQFGSSRSARHRRTPMSEDSIGIYQSLS